MIFTGGDPLKRPDLGALVREAAGLGLGVSVAPSATTRLTADVVGELKAAGVEGMSVSLDGATAARHDGIRGVPGCFDMTLRAAGSIVAAGIPLQINTLVCRETVDDLEAIAALVAGIGARRWSLFFLIAVGRGRVLTPLSAAEAERTGEWATWVDLARRMPTITLQLRVSEALQSLPRGRELAPPGERFRRAIFSFLPDIEAMELVERFFELGQRVAGTDHPIGIFLAGCRECLAEWEAQVGGRGRPRRSDERAISTTNSERAD